MDIVEKIKKAKRIYLIGNGGSYANAQHIANDLLACGIKAYTLEPSALTAFANDYGFHTVFARWLEVVGTSEDLLIALSGSGKSPNILTAIETAERIGMEVVKVFGAPQLGMQEAEEMQLVLGHKLRFALCE